jgi:hypothetical protein
VPSRDDVVRGYGRRLLRVHLLSRRSVPWPLGAWLLATRRYRTLVLAILVALVGAVVAWATIGFAEVTEYPRILLNVAWISEGRGCSLVAGLISLGVTPTVARLMAMICAIGLMGVALRHAARGARSG